MYESNIFNQQLELIIKRLNLILEYCHEVHDNSFM